MPSAQSNVNPSSSTQPSQSNDNALDSFRSEWLREVNQRQHSTTLPSQLQAQPPSSSSQPSHEHHSPSTLPSPLSIYASAVYYERVGLLDDALVHYRRAFKLEPDIDRIYQNLYPDQIQSLEPRGLVDHSNEKPLHPSLESSPHLSLFEDEYVRTRANLSNIDLPLDHLLKGKEILSDNDDSQHPSSTHLFLHSLLASFQAHPWQRDHPHSEELDDNNLERHPASEHAPLTCKNTDDQIGQDVKTTDHEQLTGSASVSIGLKFEPLDVEGQSPLQQVPLELIIKMLTVLSLRRSKIHLAISVVESFAQSCRFARILTLENSLWRSICETIYTNDLFINQEQHKNVDLLGNTSSSGIIKFKSKIDLVYGLCTKSYGLDWRRMVIEHPRIRLDGCYIALVRYPRLGESANPWYTPTHFVTYFRYLRFYENGTCLSLTSTEEPEIIVRKLVWPTTKTSHGKTKQTINAQDQTSNTSNCNENQSNMIKSVNIAHGLLFGLWSLEDDRVKIFKLHQDYRSVPPPYHDTSLRNPQASSSTTATANRSNADAPVSSNRAKYQFQMDCILSSTRRGKMNKLEIKRLATINLTNGEILEVPLTCNSNDGSSSSKPLIFSRVVSYDRQE